MNIIAAVLMMVNIVDAKVAAFENWVFFNTKFINIHTYALVQHQQTQIQANYFKEEEIFLENTTTTTRRRQTPWKSRGRCILDTGGFMERNGFNKTASFSCRLNINNSYLRQCITCLRASSQLLRRKISKIIATYHTNAEQDSLAFIHYKHISN